MVYKLLFVIILIIGNLICSQYKTEKSRRKYITKSDRLQWEEDD